MSSPHVDDRRVIEPTELDSRCDLLRSLHVPGAPLVLPNAWDVASARAVAAAGFPVVATTSGGVAASLGYEDHERAPAAEMLAAAGRIAAAVEVPVTVDAEAGYGIQPADLVAALKKIGAAGCNLEDTNHATGELRDPVEHAAWLRAVRDAAARRRDDGKAGSCHRPRRGDIPGVGQHQWGAGDVKRPEQIAASVELGRFDHSVLGYMWTRHLLAFLDEGNIKTLR